MQGLDGCMGGGGGSTPMFSNIPAARTPTWSLGSELQGLASAGLGSFKA